ncbi:MAG: hypothetical protein KDC92_07465 [Bacteroidetes bacterium]|nr:hypothetical protein [Bacteroidota bacterium]
MKRILILVILLSPFSLFSQSSNDEKATYAFKMYSNFGLGYSTFTGLNYSFGQFSPSISRIKTNGNFTELSLINFNSSKQLIGYNGWLKDQDVAYRYTNNSFSLRLEHNYKINTWGKKNNLEFYLGGFAQSNFGYYNYHNINENRLSYRYLNNSFNVGITPRLVYNVTERMSIDLNLPISLIHLSPMGSAKEYDPTISGYNSYSSRPRIDLFNPKYDLMPRIGISFKF